MLTSSSPRRSVLAWRREGCRRAAAPLLTVVAALSSPVAAQSLRLPDAALPAARIRGLPLGEVFTRTAATPNCVGNAFEMPGQAWHTDLTGGGISLRGQTLDARPATFGALYGVSPFPLGTESASSEVLIVDAFTPAPLKITTDGVVETVMLSHGALVEAHVRAVLESAGFTLRRSQPLTYGRGGRSVTVSRLDLSTLGGQTKGLVPSVVPSAALARELIRALQPGDKFLTPPDLVVNMSFAMIPCQAMTVYRDLRTAWAAATPPQRYSLNTFLEEVARASQVGIADVQRELTTVADTEPLRQTLRTLAAQRRERGAQFVAVASSGNFGLDYATAPGAFADVISAGLTRWDRRPATDQDGRVWPDAGDANVAGEWLSLSAAQLTRFCAEGGTCITDDVAATPERYAAFAYRGTSFAAPTLSVFLALQQGRASSCFTPEGTGYRPIGKAPRGTARPAFDFEAAWRECAVPTP